MKYIVGRIYKYRVDSRLNPNWFNSKFLCTKTYTQFGEVIGEFKLLDKKVERYVKDDVIEFAEQLKVPKFELINTKNKHPKWF